MRYGLETGSYGAARDAARRFDECPFVGPMRSALGQAVVDTVAELRMQDSALLVQEPVVNIDPISYKPDYKNAPTRVIVSTTLDTDTVQSTYNVNLAAVTQQPERNI